ncbi:MAG: hypothetical protein JJU29_16105 [Verrucomicrobia bacterium]|nr:hypothetical protein [Verrucomicrobiota bacterium]
MADAVFGFVLLGVVGLLLFGLAYWLRMTFYVEDAALASFVWNSLFLVMASALFILDWCQVDRGIIKPSVFLKRLSVICLLIFLYFGVTFQPSADGYGHVAHTLSVQAEELDIRIQPNQIRFLYPPKQENDGHIIYSRLRPTSEVTANELWFFFGKLEVRGLPPGIGLMAQVEEIEWTSVDRQNLASLVVEQNDSRRATTGRMSPPEITEAQLRRLLWDVSPEEEEEVQFASTRLFSSEYGDDEKFGQQPGSMRMRVRLDLYDFELIRRFPVQEGPTENRLPGGRRILSYFSNNSQPRSISFEFDLLTLHNRMRQPVGTGFESSLQIKVVDTRRNMVLQNLGGGTSNRGNWIPGFSRNPIQKVLGHVHYRADDTHEKELELVFITPVYKGSLHVEVTVDDVRLLPEDKTEEGR